MKISLGLFNLKLVLQAYKFETPRLRYGAKMIDRIKSVIKQVGVNLSDEQAEKLYKYYEMLIEKNKVMNLTAITEFEDVLVKHFCDSLAIVNVFDMSKVNSLVDVGTGAGFPGIVLKIAFPQIKVTLVDSLNKRLNFLNEVIEALSLKDIYTVHGRAEDVARMPQHREKYDLCVSRAVANLSTLAEYCIPFVKKDGFFVSYKAGDSEEEIANAKKAVFLLGGEIESVKKMVIPDTDIERTFAIIKKNRLTSNKYPRKAGLPSKEPLN